MMCLCLDLRQIFLYVTEVGIAALLVKKYSRFFAEHEGRSGGTVNKRHFLYV